MKIKFIFKLACLTALACSAFAVAADGDIRQRPLPIRPEEAGVGRMVSDLSFTSIDGTTHQLSDYRDARAVVIALTGTGCPLCLKVAPTLALIEKRYVERGIPFVFVNPNASESLEKINAAIAQHQFVGPYVQDGAKLIAQELSAKTTTEVFVLDQSRTLVYRGAVDDQYGLGYALDAPQHNYLIDALDAVLADQRPRIAAMSSPGCELYYDTPVDSIEVGAVTYHRQVARIINGHCVECHRESGIAPFPLENYQQVRDYVGMIGNVVERGVMPPWFAASQGDAALVASLPLQHWENERSLSAIEKSELLAWIKADAPRGDPADAPLARKFPDGWLIGQPDVVFEFSSPVAVKATGTMPYKNIIVDTHLDEGKWVRAMEIRPGNRSVVHHVIVSLVDDSDERSGYWGVYVPGNSTLDYPEGYAKWLPAGAKLRFQMHYTPNGTATEDSTRLGLIFAEQPPRHEVEVRGIVNPRFEIPAGAKRHAVTAQLDVPNHVQVLGFLPHMHLRGAAARYELLRDGQVETLLDVPHYDFNWQLCYRLARPRAVRPGDTIRYTAWYDNSAENPANPDPTRSVGWGEQTYDEMHLGYVEYIVEGENPDDLKAESPPAPKDAPGHASAKRESLFLRLDVDGDGFITREEVRQRLPNDEPAATTTFDRLDSDGDGKIDRQELSRL